LKLFFERLRDRMEVRFSPLFFILIDLCKNVIHEKLSRTPFCTLFESWSPVGGEKSSRRIPEAKML